MPHIVTFFFVVIASASFVLAHEAPKDRPSPESSINKGDLKDLQFPGPSPGTLIPEDAPEGRTLVHNSFKRFMIILPAIFFKLGIAFTLLIGVTLAAVNNGFIGFLILVVGLSSVLSRFQQPRVSPVPYVQPLSHYTQVWDRSDLKQPGYAYNYPKYTAK